jgi:hypothetical protein
VKIMESQSRSKKGSEEKAAPQEKITPIPATIPDEKGVMMDSHMERSDRLAAMEAYGTRGASWSHKFEKTRYATRIYNYLIGKDLDSYRISVSGDGKTLKISGPRLKGKGKEPNAFRKVRGESQEDAALSPKGKLEAANKYADELVSALNAEGFSHEAKTISGFRKGNWSGEGELLLPFSLYSKARMIQGYLDDSEVGGRVTLSSRRGKLFKDQFVFNLSSRFRPLVAKAVPQKRTSRRPSPLTAQERRDLDAIWEDARTRNAADKLELLESTATTIGKSSPDEDLVGFLLQYRGLYELAEKGGPDSAPINRSLRNLAQLRFAAEATLRREKDVVFPEIASTDEFASR